MGLRSVKEKLAATRTNMDACIWAGLLLLQIAPDMLVVAILASVYA